MKVVEIVIYGDTQKAARQPNNMSNNQRKERSSAKTMSFTAIITIIIVRDKLNV